MKGGNGRVFGSRGLRGMSLLTIAVCLLDGAQDANEDATARAAKADYPF